MKNCIGKELSKIPMPVRMYIYIYIYIYINTHTYTHKPAAHIVCVSVTVITGNFTNNVMDKLHYYCTTSHSLMYIKVETCAPVRMFLLSWMCLL